MDNDYNNSCSSTSKHSLYVNFRARVLRASLIDYKGNVIVHFLIPDGSRYGVETSYVVQNREDKDGICKRLRLQKQSDSYRYETKQG